MRHKSRPSSSHSYIMIGRGREGGREGRDEGREGGTNGERGRTDSITAEAVHNIPALDNQFSVYLAERKWNSFRNCSSNVLNHCPRPVSKF